MRKLLAILAFCLAPFGAQANTMTVDTSSLFWIQATWHASPDQNGNCYTEPLQGLNNVWMILYDFGTAEYTYGDQQPLFRSGDECIAISWFPKSAGSGSGVMLGYYEVGWQSIWGWLWAPNVSFSW